MYCVLTRMYKGGCAGYPSELRGSVAKFPLAFDLLRKLLRKPGLHDSPVSLNRPRVSGPAGGRETDLGSSCTVSNILAAKIVSIASSHDGG